MRSTRRAALGRHTFERGEAVMSAVVDIGNFSMEFIVSGRRVKALKQVSLSIGPGEIVGLVGESGSGKSTLAMAMARLLPRDRYQVTSGGFRVLGRDILNAPERELERLRGGEVSFIFQEPMNALNPTRKIGRQLLDVIEKHSGMSGQRARTRGLTLLKEMQIRDPQRVFDDYPHALSGGMRQRVLIAMAFANNPQLLIADEPTTALDVTVQAEILRMIRDQARQRGTTVLFVSHDMALVSQLCDRVAVLYRGKLVESGITATVLRQPSHPYTRDLMAVSVLAVKPKSGGCLSTENTTPLLQVDDLHVWYGARRWFAGNTRRLHALKGLSLTLQPGRTLGVIGESGSGKSSLANTLVGLVKPELGRIKICGRMMTGVCSNRPRGATPLVQMVFQDPQGSFNPRRKVWQLISEPLAVQGMNKCAGLRSLAAQMLEKVGLVDDYLYRYPHELSGGQRQRLAIARALILKPRILVLDEPTSALDVSVQAQVLQLLRMLQQEEGLGYVFISHDIAVVAHMSDSLLVMRHGEVVEQGEASAVLGNPREPYTRQLLEAAPLLDRAALKLVGN